MIITKNIIGIKIKKNKNMKKNLFAIAIVAASMFTACTESIIDDSMPEKSVAPVFTVSLADGSSTRVSMNQEGNVYKLWWENGDGVKILATKDTEATWSDYSACPNDDNQTTAVLSHIGGDFPVADATQYEAFYPSELISDDHYIVLPRWIEGSKPMLPMYAQSGDTNLSFNNLSSILQFTITADDYLEAIITLQSASKKISGICNLAIDEDGKYYLQPTVDGDISDEEKAITLTNVQFDWSGTGTVCFALPAGEYPAQDLTLSISTPLGGNKTFTLQEAIDLQRGHVKSFTIGSDENRIQFWDHLGSGRSIESRKWNSSFGGEIYKLKGVDNIYRIGSLPYGGYINFQINSDDLVYFSSFYLCEEWIQDQNERVYAWHPNNYSKDASKNKVLSYQQNGLPAVIQLAPYYRTESGSADWDFTTEDYVILITFPGSEGLYNVYGPSITTDESNNVTASYDVSLSEGFTASLTCTSIENFEPVKVTSSQNNVQLNIGTDLAPGNYNFEAKIYNGETLIETMPVSYYYANPNKWDCIKNGGYEFQCPIHSGTCEYMNLYQSKEDHSRYLMDIYWLDEHNVFFTLDENNKITVDANQLAKYSHWHDEWGLVDVYLSEYNTYHSSADEASQSYYDPSSGIYHFHLSYSTTNGILWEGWETFTPNP